MYRNIVRGAIEMMMRISRHGKTIKRISKRRRSLAGRRLNITFGAVTQTAFSAAAEAPMPRTIRAAICFRKWDTQMLRAPVCCVAHLLPRTCFRVIAINFVPDSINLSADLSSSRFRPGLERKIQKNTRRALTVRPKFSQVRKTFFKKVYNFCFNGY